MTLAKNEPDERIRSVLSCLALLILVLITYSNIYENKLLFDDALIITNNDFLKNWSTFWQLVTQPTIAGAHVAGGFYRPLQMVLYFLLYQINGPDPFYFHLLNVVLHASNACLAFLLGRRLGFRSLASFFGAALWALHPLNTEAVTYASGTAEPLFTLFCLLGLLALVPRFTSRGIWIAAICFLFALASKEGAIVFPPLVVLSVFYVKETRTDPRAYLRTWPLWIIGGAFIIWRMSAPGFDGPQTYDKFYVDHGFSNLTLYASNFSYRIYTFLATMPAYVLLTFRPTGLHMERSFPVYTSLRPIETWAGLVLVLGSMLQIAYSARWALKRNATPACLSVSWGLAWFAFAYLPDAGLIMPMNSQFLEHWMYMPLLGLSLGSANAVQLSAERIPLKFLKTGVGVTAVSLCLALGLRSFEQNEVWKDPFSFYANIFKYGEVSPRAHNNLALAFMDEGDYPAATSEFNKAISLSDTYAETRHNAALALLLSPDPDNHLKEIIADLNRAVEIDPNFYRSWETLAAIYDHTGDHDKAAYCRKQKAAIALKDGP